MRFGSVHGRFRLLTSSCASLVMTQPSRLKHAIEGAASPESKEDASPTALFEDPWMIVACRGDLVSLLSVMQSA